MSERLKDRFFDETYISQLGEAIQRVYPGFDRERFDALVHDGAWEDRALKEKMRHVTRCLHEVLPEDYPEALSILEEVGPSFHGFNAIVFSDYAECYGLEHWELSLPALAAFTRLCSSEFAIRPFIAMDPERAMATLSVWAEDEDPDVRRLASEGCRPRLPWGMALAVFKEDPRPILPILEKLKDDESEYVRKSVANNLNDISKDHPELVLDVCQRWYGQSANTDRIVKHACRTMLKAGDRRALLLFGFADPTYIAVENLTLEREVLSVGEELHFSFDLVVGGEGPSRVRLELGVDYVKARGKTSRKIFQLGERQASPGRDRVARKHSFADRSTRKHYPGSHQMVIIVNGVEKARAAVELRCF